MSASNRKFLTPPLTSLILPSDAASRPVTMAGTGASGGVGGGGVLEGGREGIVPRFLQQRSRSSGRIEGREAAGPSQPEEKHPDLTSKVQRFEPSATDHVSEDRESERWGERRAVVLFSSSSSSSD